MAKIKLTHKNEAGSRYSSEFHFRYGGPGFPAGMSVADVEKTAFYKALSAKYGSSVVCRAEGNHPFVYVDHSIDVGDLFEFMKLANSENLFAFIGYYTINHN